MAKDLVQRHVSLSFLTTVTIQPDGIVELLRREFGLEMGRFFNCSSSEITTEMVILWWLLDGERDLLDRIQAGFAASKALAEEEAKRTAITPELVRDTLAAYYNRDIRIEQVAATLMLPLPGLDPVQAPMTEPIPVMLNGRRIGTAPNVVVEFTSPTPAPIVGRVLSAGSHDWIAELLERMGSGSGSSEFIGPIGGRVWKRDALINELRMGSNEGRQWAEQAITQAVLASAHIKTEALAALHATQPSPTPGASTSNASANETRERLLPTLRSMALLAGMTADEFDPAPSFEKLVAMVFSKVHSGGTMVAEELLPSAQNLVNFVTEQSPKLNDPASGIQLYDIINLARHGCVKALALRMLTVNAWLHEARELVRTLATFAGFAKFSDTSPMTAEQIPRRLHSLLTRGWLLPNHPARDAVEAMEVLVTALGCARGGTINDLAKLAAERLSISNGAFTHTRKELEESLGAEAVADMIASGALRELPDGMLLLRPPQPTAVPGAYVMMPVRVEHRRASTAKTSGVAEGQADEPSRHS